MNGDLLTQSLSKFALGVIALGVLPEWAVWVAIKSINRKSNTG